MVDRERLEQLRAYADEVREDLERRQDEDPILDLPARVNPSVPPPLVFKTNDNALAKDDNLSPFAQPPFDDFQFDILASAIAQLRQELDVTALMQRVATLEGQVQTLLTLLGADASRSVEASETVRKLKVSRG